MAPRYLDRLRALCLALPQTYEKTACSEPTFRIVDGKIFAMHASPGNHHGGGRPSVWLHASKENQLLMIADRPDRFFSPPYVGPGGWIGVWLDGDVPWDEVRELIRDAWLRVAPKKVLVLLDAARAEPAATAVRARSASKPETGPASKSASKPASRPASTRATRPSTAKRPTAPATDASSPELAELRALLDAATAERANEPTR